MESLYRLRAEVDEANRESLIAESKKWRERAELEIASYLRVRYEIPGTTVH
jgi:CRP-like cAMP-binding protein